MRRAIEYHGVVVKVWLVVEGYRLWRVQEAQMRWWTRMREYNGPMDRHGIIVREPAGNVLG